MEPKKHPNSSNLGPEEPPTLNILFLYEVFSAAVKLRL